MIVEAIKLAGSAIGLVTGAFVLWEKLVKDRPVAFLEPRRPTGYLGAGNDIFLVVMNQARRPVFIDIPEGEAGLHFLEERTIDAAVRGAMRLQNGEPVRLTVAPQGRIEIEISSPSISLKDVGQVRLAMPWRPAHFARWDPVRYVRLPLVLRTSFEDLRRMRGKSDLD